VSAPSALGEALSALGRVLDDLGIRWYLFGAQAVVAYGQPRLTADIDVTVDLPLDRWTELVGALTEAGFSSRVDELPRFVERTRVIPVGHDPTGFPVDLVIAGPVGLEQEFLERARRTDLGGVEVSLISPEDLIVTKILAGRPKDLRDVKGIVREQGDRLDVERVRALLRLLEGALGRGDLAEELERSLGEV